MTQINAPLVHVLIFCKNLMLKVKTITLWLNKGTVLGYYGLVTTRNLTNLPCSTLSKTKPDFVNLIIILARI